MNENKKILLPEQMKAIARYEMTFSDMISLPEDCNDIEAFVTVREKYQVTLDDLYAAVTNLIRKNPTIKEFGENWYYPLSRLKEAFRIDAACGGDKKTSYSEGVAPDCFHGLPVTKEDVFARVWCEFEDVWTDWEDEDSISDVPDFQCFVREMDLFFSEQDKPITERTFTDRQKEDYIGYFSSDSHVENASELELQLCRALIDELCEKDSETAFYVKGYACYGGNRLYPCDWHVARDCMIRLYEKTDDPQYASILGYIYYYGRCTDGEPEYGKAFKMFAIAATNGFHEGIYKLGDMYRYGYSCRKSPETARNLYGIVYEDSRKDYIEGKDKWFADAALRMGDVFLKGIDEQIDPETAYSYYLQADYVHRGRVGKYDFFGFTTFSINIRKALDETKGILGENFFCNIIEHRQPRLIYALLKDNNRVVLSVEKQKNGNAVIRAQRVPVKTGKEVSPILITEPRLDWCELTKEVTLHAINIRTSFPIDGAPCRIDYAEWNRAEQRMDFYNCDQLAGWIACDAYRVSGPKKPAPSGSVIRLVTVSFHPNGRTYDYLCEDESVQVGDTVTVTGYSGETEAEVIGVYTQYESEIGLPIERYKKAVRK